MNDAQIKHMGEQFLRWQLPENFNPDGGISFEPIGNKGNSTYEFKRRPSGTNLLDYTQAEAMVRHMLDGLPAKAETTMTSNLDPAALEALVREAIEPLNDTLSSSDYSFLFDNVKDAIVKGLDTLSHAGEGEPVAKNWWVSWYSPAALGGWELNSPWWTSGYAMVGDEDVPCICAAIKANDEDDARALVFAAYDTMPKEIEFRFVNEKADDWTPFSDRFPKVDWMVWPATPRPDTAEGERVTVKQAFDAVRKQLGQAGGTGIAGEANAQVERNVVGPWLDIAQDEVEAALANPATILALCARIREPAKVKPLVWSPDVKGGLQAVAAGLVRYVIHRDGDNWYLGYDHMGKGGKAAAQADYDSRIRSALITETDNG